LTLSAAASFAAPLRVLSRDLRERFRVNGAGDANYPEEYRRHPNHWH
jgi:hypothetical protein